jgi:hypothetical protein
VLNDFIRHFEPLFYDETSLRSQHERVRRSVSSSSSSSSATSGKMLQADADRHVLRLQFTAHNR